jgi:hypothetical protein
VTVKELIEQLEDCDDNAKVLFRHSNRSASKDNFSIEDLTYYDEQDTVILED